MATSQRNRNVFADFTSYVAFCVKDIAQHEWRLRHSNLLDSEAASVDLATMVIYAERQAVEADC